MLEINNPEISVDEIMQKIREEVARRKQSNNTEKSLLNLPDSPKSALADHEAFCFEKLPSINFSHYFEWPLLEQKSAYTLSNFLDYHDDDFIRNAYRGILRREPDAQGHQYYLNQLRSGKFNKIDILGRLRFSPEGRREAIKVKGLFFPFFLNTAYKIPFFGYLFRFFIIVFRLPVVVQNIQRFEAYANWRFKQIHQVSNQELESVESCFKQINTNLVSYINPLVKAQQKSTIELQRQVDRLTHNQVEQDIIMNLVQQIEALTREKVNTDVVADLQKQLNSLAQTQTENTVFLEQVIEQMRELEQVRAVSRETLVRLQEQLQRLAQGKADAELLAGLQEQLQRLAQGKADAELLAGLQEQLQRLVQDKADAETLTGLQEQVKELAQVKVDTSTLLGLKEELSQGMQLKADSAFLSQFQSDIKDIRRQVHDHKRNILDQQRRLAVLLEEARKRLPKIKSTKQVQKIVQEEDHILDAMYAAFEDRFRGTREDIKERQRIYINYIRQAEINGNSSEILDIGCGRGEWLELLREEGYRAKGIDINRVMIQQCQDLNLDVVELDMLDYLRQQKPNSLACITGFHIIEHIPLRELIKLFDEALRVLKPQGLVIFETPNPENLITGACNFYIDPTHRNPIPPVTTECLLELRGFSRVQIVRLHRNDLDTETSLENGMLRNLLLGEQDYAAIGYKQ